MRRLRRRERSVPRARNTGSHLDANLRGRIGSGTMKMAMGRPVRIALFAAFTALVPFTASADIYQYVDSDGVVHFSNAKPNQAGAKLYLKSTTPQAAAPGTPRPGVVPYAPQDRDPTRYTRFDEHIRQASSL